MSKIEGRSMFFIVGPRKTATTWLHEYLQAHPEISLPISTKETFYFDRFFDKGVSWFEALFDKHDGRSCGEVAPSYFSSEIVASRISSLYPTSKIIICLRNPLDRLVSDYMHHVRYGHTKSDILSALNEENDLLQSSKYQENILMWRRVFGDENVSIFYYEEFLSNKQMFVDGVCKALDVDNFDIPLNILNKVENQGGTKGVSFASKLATKVVFRLRGLGLEYLVTIGKNLGLKKLIYESFSYSKKDAVSDQDKECLLKILREESDKYSEKLY